MVEYFAWKGASLKQTAGNCSSCATRGEHSSDEVFGHLTCSVRRENHDCQS